MKTTFIALAFVMTVIDVGAIPYPIEPRSLRRLVMESEYIITGHVTKIIAPANEKDKHIVVISIKEILKGKYSEETIRVTFDPYYICPAPPRYKENTDVVVFLKKHKGVFFTHALSYGAKTVSPEGQELYASRIREMQQILQISDGHKQFMATVEWLVTCTEHPETRYEGVSELSPESDFMSYYLREKAPDFSMMLSSDQRSRLKAALLSSEKDDYTIFGLVDLVYVGNEKDVYLFLLDGLKSCKEQNSYYMADGYMQRLVQYKNTQALEEISKKFTSQLFDDGKEAELKNMLDQFVVLVEGDGK